MSPAIAGRFLSTEQSGKSKFRTAFPISIIKVTGNLTRFAIHLEMTLDSMENSINCFALRIWDIFSYQEHILATGLPFIYSLLGL